MNPKICLLLVEDNPGDIRLIMEMLKEPKKLSSQSRIQQGSTSH